MTTGAKPWMRIGYVSPHPLVDTLAYEFYLMAPPNVMMVAACLEIEDYTTDAVNKQLAVLDQRVDSLVKRGATRVIISGVPIAIGLGRERLLAILDGITRRWNVPADSDLEAIIAGVKHLGARRVGLATRWATPMNEKLAAYLTEAEIEVVSVANEGRSMVENASLDDETGMRLAIELGGRALEAPGAPEALIMPGGRWITIDAVTTLEARYSKPVVTNYNAGLWAALSGHSARATADSGRLLATL